MSLGQLSLSPKGVKFVGERTDFSALRSQSQTTSSSLNVELEEVALNPPVVPVILPFLTVSSQTPLN